MLEEINYVIFAAGIVTCLISACIMAFGEPIAGLDHTCIATVIGLSGIGVITTGNTTLLVGRKKEEM